MRAQVSYSAMGDLLYIRKDGVPRDGGGRPITIRPDMTGFYRKDQRVCVGFDLLDARRILLPLLYENDMSGAADFPEFMVKYCRETDTLTIGNREESVRSEEMTEGLTAHLGPEGLANRFTLERASVILMRHFRNPIDMDDTALAGIAANETEV